LKTFRIFVLRDSTEYIYQFNVGDYVLEGHYKKLAYCNENNIVKNKNFKSNVCYFSNRVRCLLDLEIKKTSELSEEEIKIIKKEFKK